MNSFNSLMEAANGITYSSVGLKFKTDGAKRATLNLSIRIPPTQKQFRGLPDDFQAAFEAMKGQEKLSTIDVDYVLENQIVQFFATPDSKRHSLKVAPVNVHGFRFVRDTGKSHDKKNRPQGEIFLHFKASFSFADNGEAKIWIMDNGGATVFWKLEEMQMRLEEGAGSESEGE